ncbi:hypothetical protein [Peribacillus deserti]|uniref:YqgU-like 6-bladed beta-propeller domain-containing protein n=1 Tax=Peribacillus deserti TaxID=673318 RepID=A0A2N5M4A3_9BACI|nr:hypothetical protein [Peribacillus deserti]PLT29190.1 hypothetical protein CUU66_14690 [Peribacillus deserti]
MKGSWKSVCILPLSISLIATGCQFSSSDQKEPVKIPKAHGHASSNHTSIPKKINAGEEQIDKIAGWINDEEIVFSTLQGTQSLLKKMNVKSGSQSILYKSPSVISSVYISPDQSRLVIHSSLSNKKAELHVIKADGSELYTIALPSTEIHIAWNPFNEDQFLVTTFAEDWSFRCFAVDSKEQTVEDVNSAQPFVQWHSNEEYLYLDWDQEKTDKSAPLMSKQISGQSKTVIKNRVIEFKQEEDGLVTLENNSSGEGKYTFYDKDLREIGSFKVPLLESMSGWILPQTDNGSNHKFAAVIPNYKRDGNETYQLIQYNWKTGKRTIIIKDSPNEPIQLSPGGNWCLMGNRLEKIINLETKEIFNLL